MTETALPRMKQAQLRQLAQGTSLFTWWSIVTDDPAETLLAPGFWDAGREILEPGDRIDCIAAASSPEPQHLLLVVQSLKTEAGDVTLRRAAWQAQNGKTFTRPPVAKGVVVAPLRYYEPATAEVPAPGSTLASAPEVLPLRVPPS